MRLGRFRRRWRALVTVLFAILAVQLVVELANRIHHRITGRQILSTSRVTSADVTDREGAASNDANLTVFDLRVNYPVYVPSLPRFVNVDDRRAFLDDADNRVHLVVPPATAYRPTGRVRVFWNGVIRRGHECSWRTTDDEFAGGSGERSVTYADKTLCPLLVPDGQTFQHFVDGVLPKLVQLLTAAPRVADAVDSFVVYRPRDAVIFELLERVGVGRDRLTLVSPGDAPRSLQVFAAARRVVDTCVTPPVHPRLARRASQLLQASDVSLTVIITKTRGPSIG